MITSFGSRAVPHEGYASLGSGEHGVYGAKRGGVRGAWPALRAVCGQRAGGPSVRVQTEGVRATGQKHSHHRQAVAAHRQVERRRALRLLPPLLLLLLLGLWWLWWL